MVSPDLGDARIGRLRQFILLDIFAAVAAVVVMTVINIAVARSLWLIVTTGMVAVTALLMALGLRALRSGAVVGAIAWVAVGNWSIAIGASAVATFSWPIQQLAALLPAVVAVPYVSRRQFRLILVISVAVSVAAAFVGLLQDFTGLSDDLADWIPPATLIAFTPLMSLLVAQAGVGAAETLRDALGRSLEANERLSENEATLATQAGLLRESRSRIVAAGDRERRRIERDLHDGAQQRLVGLSLQISRAREQCITDPVAAQATLDEIRAEVRRAQQDMRDLVRGVYPPVLTQHGLAPAIRAIIDQAPATHRSDVRNVGRLAPEAEAAMYFACLEALQNAMKHAGPGSVVSISLRRDGADVALVVEDDGPGFDVESAVTGTGLVNMADRMLAAGGSLVIDSSPSSGTRVEAAVSGSDDTLVSH
jgi:signal transduction histidine kinase